MVVFKHKVQVLDELSNGGRISIGHVMAAVRTPSIRSKGVVFAVK